MDGTYRHYAIKLGAGISGCVAARRKLVFDDAACRAVLAQVVVFGSDVAARLPAGGLPDRALPCRVEDDGEVGPVTQRGEDRPAEPTSS